MMGMVGARRNGIARPPALGYTGRMTSGGLMATRILCALAIAAGACNHQAPPPKGPPPPSAAAPTAGPQSLPMSRPMGPLQKMAMPTPPLNIGQKVPAFQATLVSPSGEKRELDPLKTGAIRAYLFVGTTCPATRAYAARIRALEQAYTPKGVEFVFVYPNRSDSPE